MIKKIRKSRLSFPIRNLSTFDYNIYIYSVPSEKIKSFMLVGQTLVCLYGLDKLKFVLRLLWHFTFGTEFFDKLCGFGVQSVA